MLAQWGEVSLLGLRLLAVSSYGGRDRAALWGLYSKGTSPGYEGSTLKTYLGPKGPNS